MEQLAKFITDERTGLRLARISLETLSGDLPIFLAISLNFNFW